MTSNADMLYIEVVVLNVIYHFAVDMFFILNYLEH